MSMDQASLESLISGLSLETFFKCYRSSEPLFIPAINGPSNELMNLPLLDSLESLISLWPEKINSYLPGIADEVNSQSFVKEEALELFKKGRGLFFDDPNRFDVVIETWLKALHRDLGLSHLTYSRSLIYAIAKGKGTAAHFDQNINFVLQVSGTKKWWLAKNDMVSNPMTRYTIGTPMDLELESYLEGPKPLEFPENAQEFELAPGSLLFVPRGVWHKTEALSDAISLNFTFSSPTWIDLLTSSLRARLAQSSSWRENASFVNDPLHCFEAEQEFDQLLAQLKTEFVSLRASDILGATEYNPEE